MAMDTSLQGMSHTLSHVTAQVITPLAFRDDRVSHLLNHVSQPA